MLVVKIAAYNLILLTHVMNKVIVTGLIGTMKTIVNIVLKIVMITLIVFMNLHSVDLMFIVK